MKQKLLLLIVTLFIINLDSYAAVRTWNGGIIALTNNNWNRANNWTPSGVPGVNDDVVIANTGILSHNTINLNVAPTVKSITWLNNGDNITLNINNNTITITELINVTTGNITSGANGAIIANNLTSFNFRNNTCAATFTVSASNIDRLFGNTFIRPVSITKIGANGDFNNGGNVFQAATVIINNSDANLRFGTGTRDQFNANLTIQNTGSGQIQMSYNTANNTFNNIILESTGTGSIRFGDGNGTSTMANNRTITIGATGFVDGDLWFSGFTKTGNSPIAITLGGTTTRIVVRSSVWNCPVEFIASRINTGGSTYQGVTSFEKTGAGNDDSPGGNTFNGVTTLTHSGEGIVRFGNVDPDVFNATLNIINQGSGNIRMGDNSNGNVFHDLIINNTSSDIIYFCNQTGTATINGNIELSSSANSGGVRLSASFNSAITQIAGRTITIGAGGYNGGNIFFRNFTKLGADAVSLTIGGSEARVNLENSVWNGSLSIIAPRIATFGSTYNSTLYLEKTAGGNDDSPGGNTFNGATTIIHSGTNIFRFANANPDIFNANLTLLNQSSGPLRLADNSTGNQFNGVINAHSSSNLIQFCNTDGATATFSENVILRTSGTSTGVRIAEGNNAGGVTLAATKLISIAPEGFLSGILHINRVTQLGNESIDFTLHNNAVAQLNNSIWNGEVIVAAGRVTTNGCHYHNIASLSKNGSDNDNSGGNTFEDETTIVNNGTGNFRFGVDNRDVFNGEILIQNTGSSDVHLAYSSVNNEMNANVIISNTSNNSLVCFADQEGATLSINENIELNSTVSAGGITFGENNTLGSITLADTKEVLIGASGIQNGRLVFSRFNQLANISTTINCSDNVRLAISNAVWTGDFVGVSGRITTRETHYKGMAHLEKTSSTNDNSAGGNIFDQDVEVVQNGTGTMSMSTSLGLHDTYYGDVLFVRNSGQLVPSANNNDHYYGNININATSIVVIGASGGGIRLLSNTNQSITNLNASPFEHVFNNIVLDKPSGDLLLNTPIAISGQVTFNSGLIQVTEINTITVNNGANVSAASNNSHVNGKVRKVGTDNFIFPIGVNGVYRPIGIMNPSDANTMFEAYYMPEDPNQWYNDLERDETITHVSSGEFWMLNKLSGTGSAYVSLYWDSSSDIDNVSEIIVSRWDGTKWQNYGNGVTDGDADFGYVRSTISIENFSPFTFGSISVASNPLPVDWLSFDIEKLENSVELHWKTSLEKNNDYFIIERSVDQTNWVEIGEVEANGITNEVSEYTYQDNNINAGVVYYRIRQVDYDGKFEHSVIKAVYLERKNAIEVYPTVTSGYVTIVHGSLQLQKAILYDQLGRMYSFDIINNTNGEYNLNLAHLAKGMYTLTVLSDEEIHTDKIIVQ